MGKYKTRHISILKAEYEVYVNAMIKADFSKTKAAEILHVSRKTIYNKFLKFKEAGLHSDARTPIS